MEHRDLLPAIITCLALLVYVWNFMACGRARSKYGVNAPAVTGDAAFERQFRVQQNMLEQLMIFIPALWIFSLTVQVLIGAVLGILFVIGRILYSVGYAKAAEKRGLGFGISALCSLILLVGGLIGAIRLFAMDA